MLFKTKPDQLKVIWSSMENYLKEFSNISKDTWQAVYFEK